MFVLSLAGQQFVADDDGRNFHVLMAWRISENRHLATCRPLMQCSDDRLSPASRKIPAMLNDRARRLLKTLVERYIADGQPVGSRTLTQLSGLDISPASVRNVMAELEDMGLVASPHTSAGRVPTARGYRVFVDKLLTMHPLEQQALRQVESGIHPDSPLRMAAAASQLLSDLTHFAGVVITPQRADAAFRQIEFLRLSEKRILLILVTPLGDVQNHLLVTDRDYTPGELIETANYLNHHHYAGQSLEHITRDLEQELASLQAWKKFRVALNRLDLSAAPDIDWPAVPE